MAAAIATAESQGNPTIQNPTNANVVGLWQINTSPDANPEYTIAQMKNPLANAVAAVKISGNGTNWNAWQTYTSGAYLKYLQNGVTPIAATNSTNLTASQIQDIVDAINNGNLSTLTPAEHAAYVAWLTNPTSDNALGNAILKDSTLEGSIFHSTSPLINSGVNSVYNAIPGFSTLSGFFSTISSGKFWIRALEVVGGGLILLLALDETVKAAGSTPPSTAVGNTITATTGVK